MLRKKKDLGFLFSILSVLIILAVWWILSVTVFRRNGALPSPPDTFLTIIKELKTPARFFKGIFSTLGQSSLSFLISFILAFGLALLAHYKKFVRKIINPFIIVFRSMPTMAIVLILFMIVPTNMVTAAIAFLVVFPLCYENMYTAFSGVDQKLVNMAKVFKVPKRRQIFGIYLPAMVPYIFASIIGGFGLNIKVVISAETVGYSPNSIGYYILNATGSLNYDSAFAWLVIAVLMSLVFEAVFRIIRRLCMPYKYPDLKILKGIFIKRGAGK